MIKRWLLTGIWLCAGILYGEDIDCDAVIGHAEQCDPYPETLLKATKKVTYDRKGHRLIVEKTLPVPPQPHIRIIPVEAMIERYIRIHPPKRFEGEARNRDLQNIHKITKYSKEKKITQLKPLEAGMQEVPITKKKNGIYTVRSGDNLSKVAWMFSTKLSKIMQMNNLHDKDRLKVGDRLRLPFTQETIDAICDASYTVNRGDTLLSIAQKFHVDPKMLAKENNIRSSSDIYEGRVMMLPLPYKLAQKTEKRKKIRKKVRKHKGSKLIHAHGKRKLRVTATAYTSHRGQTDSTPFLAAWNNRLRPGMKVIAVSRDLISRYGLRNGTKVRISGLRGIYRVRDKMNKRYKRRIDIYMGKNRRRALRWGRRSVVISW